MLGGQVIIADLHIHSRFSRATSKQLDINNLEKYARIKGIGLLGTGDFTHPVWIEELKKELVDDGSGILRTKTGFPFMLSGEISLMYSQGGKGRKVHLVLLAKGFDVVQQINEYLLTKGRTDYDGRPIFGISGVEFLENIKQIDDKIEVIPAHVWTPWFGLFGSMSGFDSVEECFQDKAKHIYALETGLSSDPPMNWRLSALDSYSLVSFSDLHSFWPWRLGREATLFDVKLEYDNVIRALRTKKGLEGTVEVDPGYGKYHFDGHRACDVCLEPKETARLKGVCPKCGKSLTIGVLNRVESLADRAAGFRPEGAKDFYTLLPLTEILSALIGSPLASKKTWKAYYDIVNAVGSEYDVLMRASEEELMKLAEPRIVKAIIRNRHGNIEVDPGYDGEYGKPVLSEKETKEKIKPKHVQLGLDDF